jgi:hypothetical protein
MLAAWSPAVRADEPARLFVEQLRSAGLADVALEYLEHVRAAAPPGLRGRLLLERAKCLAELADRGDDETRCDRQRSDARSAIETWLRNVTDPAMISEGQAALAGLCQRQGLAHLERSRRALGRSERQDAAAVANALLGRSIQLVEAMRGNLSATLSGLGESPADAERAADLTRQLRETELELAKARFHQAQVPTGPERDGIARRNAGLEAARRQFLELAREDDAVAWQARAWVGRCWLELDNIGEARKALAQVEREAVRPAAAGGVRAARYYQLLVTERDPGVRSRAADIIRGANEWLDRYRDAADSADGRAVRLLLARHWVAQAQASGSREPLRRAVDVLTELSEAGGELAAAAGALRLEAADHWLGDESRVPATFGDGYLAAQVELHRRSRLAEGPAGGARSERVSRAVTLLERALGLATAEDSRRAVFDARLLLCYCHLLDGHAAAAAVLGEHLARSTGDSPRAARAAIYALSAWTNLIADAAAVDEAIARERLVELAGLIESRWAAAPEADTARFQLGELAFADRRYAHAAAQYGRVQPSFGGYTFAKYRQGVAAQLAVAAGAPGELLSTAIADLRRVEDLPVGASADSVRTYAHARLQLATLLLLAGTGNAEAAAIGRQIATGPAKSLPADDAARGPLLAEAVRLWALAASAHARHSLKSGRIGDARAALAPLVSHVRSSAGELVNDAADHRRLTPMVEAVTSALAVDVLAGVRSGRAAALREHLALVHRLGDINGFAVRVTDELHGETPSSAAVASVVEEVSRQQDLLPATRLRLADRLSAVGRHEQAAAVLSAIAAPPANDADGLRVYRTARISLAREYRLAKALDRAKAILREALGTPGQKGWGFDNLDVRREAIALCEADGNFAGAVQMAVQAQTALGEALREYEAKSARLQQLGGEVGAGGDAPGALRAAALTERDRLQADLRRLAPLRERYFEFYRLEVAALVRHAESLEPAPAAELFGRLAVRLAKLERTQPDVGGSANRAALAELVGRQPALRQQYQAAGGRVLLTP